MPRLLSIRDKALLCAVSGRPSLATVPELRAAMRDIRAAIPGVEYREGREGLAYSARETERRGNAAASARETERARLAEAHRLAIAPRDPALAGYWQAGVWHRNPRAIRCPVTPESRASAGSVVRDPLADSLRRRGAGGYAPGETREADPTVACRAGRLAECATLRRREPSSLAQCILEGTRVSHGPAAKSHGKSKRLPTVSVVPRR